MGDSVNGWQTVLPSTHNRVERLDDKSQLELEAYERQTLEFWSGLDGGWSGWSVTKPISWILPFPVIRPTDA